MLKKDSEGCPQRCQACCCQYIVHKIKAPRTKSDFDELYWFLCHERIVVYVERRKWFLLMESQCRYLDDNSRCKIYHHRPNVCRLHSIEECEYQGEVNYDLYMDSPEDLKRYMKKRGLTLRMAWNDPDLESDLKPKVKPPF